MEFFADIADIFGRTRLRLLPYYRRNRQHQRKVQPDDRRNARSLKTVRVKRRRRRCESSAGRGLFIRKVCLLINDLLIMTEFSADNIFGGTMKSIAVRISSYSDNMVTLITIE